ncbi:oxidoreductase family protein, partial [Rhodococcus sp. HNM0569]|uniref:oxidoreductase family protein n=1 Tax=Rhodococcus sp. HNM0569 TaxID=2716340 RepID=UPI00146E22EF
ATDTFVDGLGDLLDDRDRATLAECVDVAYDWALARASRFALVHGDYRLDNLLFPTVRDAAPPDARRVVAVDWQTLSLALPARDLAYVLGTGLAVADRRAYEQQLVRAYHDALLRFGVAGYTLDDCWDDYRFAMLQGPLVSVFGCAYGTRSPRGDRMFAAMVTRACAAIRDLGTLDAVRGESP